MAMVVIGGIGSTWGGRRRVGLTLLPEAIRFVNDYRLLVFGGLLVLVDSSRARRTRGADQEIGVERARSHDAALQLDNIAVRFGGVQAVDGVSMSIEAGEFVGLIGPNGAGKTTLIRIVAGGRRSRPGTRRCSPALTSPTSPPRLACARAWR